MLTKEVALCLVEDISGEEYILAATVHNAVLTNATGANYRDIPKTVVNIASLPVLVIDRGLDVILANKPY
jgi:hypothetical protein